MYLVDGYNLLHAPRAPWGVSARRPLPRAIRLLISGIQDFCARKNTEALVVFDGNPPPDPPDSTPSVRIRFTGKERSADDLLAELAARTGERTAPKTVIVSSDRTVAASARSQMCRALTSEAFMRLMTVKNAAGKETVRSGRDHALSDREVDAWLKKFGYA